MNLFITDQCLESGNISSYFFRCCGGFYLDIDEYILNMGC